MTTPAHEVHAAVQARYAQIATTFTPEIQANCGCDDTTCCPTGPDLYDTSLADLPADVTSSRWVVVTITLAGLQPGQTVLDLGSGGVSTVFWRRGRLGHPAGSSAST